MPNYAWELFRTQSALERKNTISHNAVVTLEPGFRPFASNAPPYTPVLSLLDSTAIIQTAHIKNTDVDGSTKTVMYGMRWPDNPLEWPEAISKGTCGSMVLQDDRASYIFDRVQDVSHAWPMKSR